MELKLDRNKTYGLALEGGGAKGAYQIGAWKALREAASAFPPCPARPSVRSTAP